ncbi:MAG: hypothetical protein EZS26_001013 [Candidatus Ordinivivax streblomastigis]|uniref:YubB ferredoxin-like domain-containing protein n=1 Tax=Candidatus Ordinivivax streblomastigis TaxID=2540710 RepID=A0A5M8P312_9BACT|nr:MAG: hypothetical protein EZS26_001013 [Candidatus Ordinivivax streblomastigis]
MRNWCYTNYVIEGDKEEVADLMQKLKSLEDKDISPVKNDFGKLWLGNVVFLFGGDYEKIDCRGEFMNLERNNETSLIFDTCTAWVDKPEVWNFVCEKYKSLRYYFFAEASGICYYTSNDKEGKCFSGKYYVEQWYADPKFPATEKELYMDISLRTGIVVGSKKGLKEAIDTYNASHEDKKIFVHEITIV